MKGGGGKGRGKRDRGKWRHRANNNDSTPWEIERTYVEWMRWCSGARNASMTECVSRTVSLREYVRGLRGNRARNIIGRQKRARLPSEGNAAVKYTRDPRAASAASAPSRARQGNRPQCKCEAIQNRTRDLRCTHVQEPPIRSGVHPSLKKGR